MSRVRARLIGEDGKPVKRDLYELAADIAFIRHKPHILWARGGWHVLTAATANKLCGVTFSLHHDELSAVRDKSAFRWCAHV